MSLNWSAENVAQWDEIRLEDGFDSKLEIVIFDTMHVGMPRITKANVGEFHRRQLMVRAAMGNSYKDLQLFEEWMPESFIESLVGLSTNASTKTITAFNKDLLANIESRVYGIRNKGK